jgi:hypothetical protein
MSEEVEWRLLEWVEGADAERPSLFREVLERHPEIIKRMYDPEHVFVVAGGLQASANRTPRAWGCHRPSLRACARRFLHAGTSRGAPGCDLRVAGCPWENAL